MSYTLYVLPRHSSNNKNYLLYRISQFKIISRFSTTLVVLVLESRLAPVCHSPGVLAIVSHNMELWLHRVNNDQAPGEPVNVHRRFSTAAEP